MLRAICVLALVALVTAGCETVKVPTSFGGSRADGTVVMGYEYGAFEIPKVDHDATYSEALRICRNWDYQRAESFGGAMRECVSYSQYGCNRWTVTFQYQCINFEE